jgi:hypothetical protein
MEQYPLRRPSVIRSIKRSCCSSVRPDFLRSAKMSLSALTAGVLWRRSNYSGANSPLIRSFRHPNASVDVSSFNQIVSKNFSVSDRSINKPVSRCRGHTGVTGVRNARYRHLRDLGGFPASWRLFPPHASSIRRTPLNSLYQVAGNDDGSHISTAFSDCGRLRASGRR